MYQKRPIRAFSNRIYRNQISTSATLAASATASRDVPFRRGKYGKNAVRAVMGLKSRGQS